MKKIISIRRKPEPSFESNDYIPDEILESEDVEVIEQKEEVIELKEIIEEKEQLIEQKEVIEPKEVIEQKEVIEEIIEQKEIIEEKKQLIEPKEIIEEVIEQQEIIEETININHLVKPSAKKKIKKKKNDDNIYDNFLVEETSKTEIKLVDEIQTISNLPSSTKPIEITVHRCIKKKKRGN